MPLKTGIGALALMVLLTVPAWSGTPVLPPSPVGTVEEPSTSTETRIRAQLNALEFTTLSSELTVSISKLDLREGESFAQGDLLVSFDCELYRAQLRKAQATAEGSRKSLQVQRKLAEFSANSGLELALAAAKAAETTADVAVMEATVKKCDIRAPFPGKVVKRLAEPHQSVTAGKPLLDILNPHRLEIRLIVPSKWLTWIKEGSSFTLHVEETNKDYPARVTRLGTLIDAVSQSVPLAGVIDPLPVELLPGMSGWATFPPRP